MPETPVQNQPGLWAKAWRKPSVRWGTRLTLAIVLIGVYAPFLANDTALIWHDASGWSLPAVGDLFNRWSYPKYYDVYFNVAALLLPGLLVGGWLLRRRWSLPRRLVIGALLILAAGTGALLPLFPSAQGFQSVWRHRQQSNAQVGQVTPTVTALFAPVPFRATVPVSGQVLQAPLTSDPASGRRFWLGTDSVGKDVAAQMIAGARISLTVGLVATGLSLLIGLLIGALSGYLGGWVDLILQRVVEIMMCFPTFILILVVVAMTGRDIFVIMLVIGLTGWAGIARLVRGEYLAQSVRDYVAAGQALGLGPWRIMFRHILPNALTPLLITATFGVAGAVGSESGLSFLGLGDPTIASWGTLLEQGRQNIDYWWLIWLPGIAVFALISALNLIGNGLREAVDAAAE
jgi:peptide/nickel transport system permease protein